MSEKMENRIETEAPPPVSSLRSRWEAMSKKTDVPEESKGGKPSLIGVRVREYARISLTLLISIFRRLEATKLKIVRPHLPS